MSTERDRTPKAELRRQIAFLESDRNKALESLREANARANAGDQVVKDVVHARDMFQTQFLLERAGRVGGGFIGQEHSRAMKAYWDTKDRSFTDYVTLRQARNARRCQRDSVYSAVYDVIASAINIGKVMELKTKNLRGVTDVAIRVTDICYEMGLDMSYEGASLLDAIQSGRPIKLTPRDDKESLGIYPSGEFPAQHAMKFTGAWVEDKG